MKSAEHEEDEEAELVALFDSNVDDLFRFCLARSGSKAIADDATAEAFLAAARTFAAGGGSEVTRGWLFVVARRRMHDQWRANERERKRISRLREIRQEESDLNLTQQFDSEPVLEALRSLSPRQRAAMTMRYLDDYSVSEVAEALGVTYRAAESLLARGRRGFEQAWSVREETVASEVSS